MEPSIHLIFDRPKKEDYCDVLNENIMCSVNLSTSQIAELF